MEEGRESQGFREGELCMKPLSLAKYAAIPPALSMVPFGLSLYLNEPSMATRVAVIAWLGVYLAAYIRLIRRLWQAEEYARAEKGAVLVVFLVLYLLEIMATVLVTGILVFLVGGPPPQD